MEKCVFSHGEKSIWKEREMNTFPSLSIYFFPIFPHGEKSIWKEREMNTFPFLSIYFFTHFSPWGKMGKHKFFHGQKWGWTPPPNKRETNRKVGLNDVYGQSMQGVKGNCCSTTRKTTNLLVSVERVNDQLHHTVNLSLICMFFRGFPELFHLRNT